MNFFVCLLFVGASFEAIRALRSPSRKDFDFGIHFDYIIIGSGPAGSILSRRLTDEGFQVLLLEAGDATQFDLGGKRCQHTLVN